MAKLFYFAGLFVVTTAALSLGACSDETTSTGGEGGGEPSGTTATSASATTGMMAGSGGNGSGGSGGGSSTAGYCGKSCAMPKDCCTPGVPNCPDTKYPNNWTCDSGACGAPQCAVKDDCTFNGALPEFDCLTLDDNKFCAEPCTADADCTAPLKCTGDAGGTKYCAGESSGGCKADADCMGYGKCDVASGACGCEADADCTAMGVDKCVKP